MNVFEFLSGAVVVLLSVISARTVLPALLAALRNGWIAGAGLDVLDEEPPPPDHPLYGSEHVIITPHVSAAGPRVFDQRAAVFAENLRRDAAGEPLLNGVDAARGY